MLKNRKIGFPLEMDFFAFVIGWHVAATRMAVHEYILSLPIVKWSTALSVKHHTKIQFFSSSGHTIARKCFLKTGEKKRVYATLLFSRVYLYRGQS